jgi:hypothetical protein
MADHRFTPETPNPNGQPPPHLLPLDLESPLDVPTLAAETLLGLLMAHPHLQRALKRDPETDPTRHGIYDAMLAEAALQDSWNEGAIVALIQEGNTRNSLPPPAVGLCRVILHEAHLRTKTGDLDFARERLLDQLSDVWGLQIHNVIRHGTENALWHLHLVDGREIQLGTSEDLMSQSKVRARIFDVTGHIIPRYSAKDARLWDHHIEMLALVARTVDTPEMTREGQAKALIMGYLEEQDCTFDHETSKEEWGELALANRPFFREGLVYISARNLWLTYVHGVAPKMDYGELLDLLRLLGGRRITLTIHERSPERKTTSRSMWRLAPAHLVETEIPEMLITSSRED